VVLNKSKKIIDYYKIIEKIDFLAERINEDYGNTNLLVLCVMSGGMVFCGHLLCRLKPDIEFDYVHVSRYGNKTTGGDLVWLKRPSQELNKKNVIIIDDLLDQGLTLQSIYKYCIRENVSSVKSAVLFRKQKLNSDFDVNYIGFDVPDEYIFGFGIDYKNRYRNLPDLYSVSID